MHKYQGPEHEAKYNEYIALTGTGNISEYKAALFILASPLLADKTAQHVTGQGIALNDIMEKKDVMSSGEKALLSLAANLFNGSWPADVNETLSRLDNGNLELALEAIKIRYL